MDHCEYVILLLRYLAKFTTKIKGHGGVPAMLTVFASLLSDVATFFLQGLKIAF